MPASTRGRGYRGRGAPFGPNQGPGNPHTHVRPFDGPRQPRGGGLDGACQGQMNRAFARNQRFNWQEHQQEYPRGGGDGGGGGVRGGGGSDIHPWQDQQGGGRRRSKRQRMGRGAGNQHGDGGWSARNGSLDYDYVVPLVAPALAGGAPATTTTTTITGGGAYRERPLKFYEVWSEYAAGGPPDAAGLLAPPVDRDGDLNLAQCSCVAPDPCHQRLLMDYHDLRLALQCLGLDPEVGLRVRQLAQTWRRNAGVAGVPGSSSGSGRLPPPLEVLEAAVVREAEQRVAAELEARRAALEFECQTRWEQARLELAADAQRVEAEASRLHEERAAQWLDVSNARLWLQEERREAERQFQEEHERIIGGFREKRERLFGSYGLAPPPPPSLC